MMANQPFAHVRFGAIHRGDDGDVDGHDLRIMDDLMGNGMAGSYDIGDAMDDVGLEESD